MALIVSPIPQPGEAGGVATAEAMATNALTEIKNLLNGSLETDNLALALRNRLSPPLVTVPPSSPTDGDRFVYPGTNRVEFRYEAATSRWYPLSHGHLAASYTTTDQAIATGASNEAAVVNLGVGAPAAGQYWIKAFIRAWKAGNGGGEYRVQWNAPTNVQAPVGIVADDAEVNDQRVFAPSLPVELQKDSPVYVTARCSNTSNPQVWSGAWSYIALVPIWLAA
jgi:hypothetical protein